MSALDSYKSSHAAFAVADSEWMRDNRATALSSFEATGFPTIRHEAWKYTSTKALQKLPFAHTGTAGHVAAALQAVEAHRMPQAAAELVFINGQLSDELSRTDQLPDRVTVSSLSQALAGPAALKVQLWLSAGDNLAEQPFDALNLAFFQDGALIEIRRDAVIDGPIHLLFVSHSDGEPVVNHPRVLVLAGRHSQATVIERHIVEGQGATFSNVVSQVSLQDGAKLAHHIVHAGGPASYHRSHVRAHVGRSASYTNGSWWLGGLWARQDLDVKLAAEGAEGHLNGLYLPTGKEHVDNHTCVEHAEPHGISRELYKGVLAGRGRAVFNGRILVALDAQHTDSEQSNRNLLLSDGARVDTKPELEIYADDVTCAHGTTVGQLDDEAVFYLRTRGIPKSVAHRMLTSAFVRELIDPIACEPLRAWLEAAVQARLSTMHAEAP